MADFVKRNHWVVRLTHWVNVVAVIVMAGSGMRIFNAHPAFARPGETFLLGASTLPFIYNVIQSSRGPKVTTDDPWG